jgi:hypothetical protein
MRATIVNGGGVDAGKVLKLRSFGGSHRHATLSACTVNSICMC